MLIQQFPTTSAAHLTLVGGMMAPGRNSFRIQVCRNPSNESLSGYPKYASNEVRAHAIAEDAVRELQSARDPGEYLITVSLKDTTPLGTQVVVVPSEDFAEPA